MAEQQLLRLIVRGAAVWNQWRLEHPLAYVDFGNSADLAGADLSGADLRNADLHRAFLHKTNLSGADLGQAFLSRAVLSRANLSRARLSRADLSEANLSGANLSGADLSEANLGQANLSWANLNRADLGEATLTHATLVETDLGAANLTGCRVYGASAWNLRIDDKTKQDDLIITRNGDPTITVDNLEVAQFIYILLDNQRVRHVIDTITSKVVLILGRFTAERKRVLDSIREELRKLDYLPILFDFEKPANRDITETVSTLAHMARFIIADLTDAKSIPQELSIIVPALPSVAVQPLLDVSDGEYGMFEHWERFPWVLPIHRYEEIDSLLASISECVIAPAEQKVRELKGAAVG